MQHLWTLWAESTERGCGREPVVADVSTVAVAALADSMDEVVLDDAVSKRGANVDRIARTFGLAAMEVLQGRIVEDASTLGFVEDGREFAVYLVDFPWRQEPLDHYGAVFVPVLKDVIQWRLVGDFA